MAYLSMNKTNLIEKYKRFNLWTPDTSADNPIYERGLIRPMIWPNLFK
jgi:hypothetical protein